MTSSLVLASGSDYKRQLLERLGISFEVDPAGIDESAEADEPPRRTARRLAAEKARAVADRRDGFVLAADQTIALDGRRFRKPGSPSAAAEQLETLAGSCHDLWCAVALVAPDGTRYDDDVHFEMVMRELTDDEIRRYVAEDHPVDCAGAYKVESGGIRLFRALRGDDYTAIVGLPLTRVWKLLEQSDYFDAPPPDRRTRRGGRRSD